jgi:diketogulonate reductase-like aldo/keto reductase
VKRLAAKYGKTPAQILLRQLTQRGICVIPKSTNEKRLLENINVSPSVQFDDNYAFIQIHRFSTLL